jgi:hypothetical protein
MVNGPVEQAKERAQKIPIRRFYTHDADFGCKGAEMSEIVRLPEIA